jgi:hypothetical protein
MKKKLLIKNLWLLLLTPFFIQGVCNKDNDDVEAPNSDQYVTWQISGANGNLKLPADSLDFYWMGNGTAIYGMTKPVPTTAFAIVFGGQQQTGTYAASNFAIYSGGKYYVPTSTPLQVNVTSYGGVGQHVMGTYSGNVKDSATSAIIPVSGEFRIKNK